MFPPFVGAVSDHDNGYDGRNDDEWNADAEDLRYAPSDHEASDTKQESSLDEPREQIALVVLLRFLLAEEPFASSSGHSLHLLLFVGGRVATIVSFSDICFTVAIHLIAVIVGVLGAPLFKGILGYGVSRDEDV